jgi:Rod binding domain-containing protein
MSTFSIAAVPLDMLKPVVSAPSVAGASDNAGKLAAITKTAKDFESSFLSSMLGQMFEGLSTDGPFGGGQGEAMFRSVMMDAFGKQITKAGGVGVAAAVQREMLKMQGLG